MLAIILIENMTTDGDDTLLCEELDYFVYVDLQN